jgi:hypothetical protein
MDPMTAEQTLRSSLMVPGGYELGAPNHREPHAVAAVAQHPTLPDADVYVVAAPPQATTWLGRAGAIFSDLAVVTGILFAIALTPIAVVRLVTFVAGLVTGR